MSARNHRAPVVCCAFLAAAGAFVTLAGPLDPPNGPITSTYKTLSDVEPRIAINAANTPGDGDSVFRLVNPGSYYLTGPLDVPSGKSGIEIAGPVITVDLNGFRLGGLDNSRDGIHVNGAMLGITIRNGVIHTAGGDGIDAVDASTTRIESVTVLDCVGQGIVVGIASEVARCTVQSNGSHGINTREACRVTDCTARGNGGIGIDVDNDSSVRDCIATGNVGEGISGNDGCTVSGCTASSNTGNGINTQGASIVSGSVGRANGGIGIDVDSIAIVRDCTARDNTGDGITADNGSVITASTAGVNQSGFAAGTGASISGCNAHANRANGIEFGSNSDLRTNNATGHASGAGLYTTGNHSQMDENQSLDNAVGIALYGHSCTIHRNTVVPNGVRFSAGDDDFYIWNGYEPWENLY
jgi:hypothetical protein